MEKGVTIAEMSTGSVGRGIIELEGSHDCNSSEISLGTDLYYYFAKCHYHKKWGSVIKICC